MQKLFIKQYIGNLFSYSLEDHKFKLSAALEEIKLQFETELVQNKLNELLKHTILPNTKHEIDCKWSGIMGFGLDKKPIVKPVGKNIFCG